MAQPSAESLAAVARRHAPIGAALGLVAALVSYALTYLLLVLDGLETSEEAAWKVVGLVWYSAHNVEIVGTGRALGRTASRSVNVVADDGALPLDLGAAVPTVTYYLVPILLFVVAGFLTVRLAGGQLDEAGSGAAAGATLVLGALVTAVLGSFLFEITLSAFGAQVTFAPALVPAVLLVGILYPAVFGAIGGAVASR